MAFLLGKLKVPGITLSRNDTGEATEAGALSAGTSGNGNVLANDAGLPPLLVLSFRAGGLGQTSSASSAAGSSIAGLYGNLTLRADGSYSYHINNSSATVNALAQGQSLQEVFTYTVGVFGSRLLTDNATLSITVKGANDAVVITGPAGSGAVAEDGTGLASGSIGFSDLDLADTHTASAASAAANSTALGSFALGAVNEAPNAATGAVPWTYTLNNQAAQYLGAGDSVTEVYNVSISDGKGSTATTQVSVTIAGSNDAAVIGTPGIASVTEDANVVDGQLTASGTLAISDVDQNQAAFRTEVLSQAGNLGTLSIAANGSYTYAVDNNAVQFLDAGAVQTDTFTVTALDGTTANVNFSITGVNDATRISAIQGADDISPLVGQTVMVQARVTAWLPGMNLFFIQEESFDRDNNALTSEGIAVFYGNTGSPVDAGSIGDVVRFTGTVVEFNGLTELTTVSNFQVVSNGTAADLDPATQVLLPIANGSTLERFEGERVEISAASGSDLFVADTFTFARFGETTLYADAVPFQFTEINAPSVSGNAAYLDFLGRNSIQLDDGSSVQNPSLTQLNANTRILRDTTNDGVANGTALGADGLGNVNFIRAGDTAGSVTGVLGYGFGSYELLPTETVALTAAPRPSATPDVGAAEVKVASFNVLNYFTTLGSASFTNPAGVTHEGRGANNAIEFAQQQAKIVAAMLATGAHVFGLNEIQNNGFGASSAIASLVNALNAADGSSRFAYITSPSGGTDAIMVGIVYDSSVVSPLGSAVNPNTTTYSAFAGQSRLPVAQTFGYLNDDSR
ncbi:MAG: VCBS domain-containing protein, partial [Pseudomonadota bacterium]